MAKNISVMEDKLDKLKFKLNELKYNVHKAEINLEFEKLSQLGYKPNTKIKAYKAAKMVSSKGSKRITDVILTLEIPKHAFKMKAIYGANGTYDLEDAIREKRKNGTIVFYTHDKIRVSEAKVIAVEKLGSRDQLTKLKAKEITGKLIPPLYAGNFEYKLGETVKPDFMDKDPFEHCSHGIHCFESKKQAIEYARNGY